MVFELLLADHDPKLAQHLAENDILSLMYITQWFMKIFTDFNMGLSFTRLVILNVFELNLKFAKFHSRLGWPLWTVQGIEQAFKIRLKRSVIRRITKRVNAMEKNNEVWSDAAYVNTAGGR
ncbi:3677_t:CDS:2 [Funneliformis mosseae]|uniref:3677_t:CDS:1 n=1 Tax=Funneliformis mosseae TaxID=27381 RepID=A0A9N9GGF2_FUNMO|nr:3677_t:CDS:2 [Funneliformis mosseae]